MEVDMKQVDIRIFTKLIKILTSHPKPAMEVRDAYFTLFVDIHPGKVYPFYSVYLTNWEKLPIFGHFYPGRVFYFAVKYSPLSAPGCPLWASHRTCV